MYFYILERPRNAATKRLYERIRELVAQEGILGEFALSSPARTPEEIAEIGIKKGYTSIVVVGSDLTVNKVAKVVSMSSKAVLGVIPIDDQQSVCQLINVSHWRQAVESLKRRHLSEIHPTFLPPNKYFITNAYIYSEGNNPTYLNINDQFVAAFSFTQITIKPNLSVEVIDQSYGQTFFSQKINWLLGKQPETIAYSHFKADYLTLSSKRPLYIILNNEIVAKSPLRLETKNITLNIITNHAKIQM